MEQKGNVPSATLGVSQRISEHTARLSSRALGRPGALRRPVLFLLIALVLGGIASPAFLSPANINALLISSSFLIVVTVGEAVVILLGMIDLGVQSVLASAGMLVAYLDVFRGLPWWQSVPLTLLFGVLVGVIVGLVVAKGRIPSFIVTLGTYWGFAGVALLFNQGNYISPFQASQPRQTFQFAAVSSHTLGISNLILISVIVVLGTQAVLTFTPLGPWIRSVGSAEPAAFAAGLDTTKLKILGFVFSGALAALAGIMITAWQSSIYPNTGQGYSLEAIAGVILGGIPFKGGRGTILGAAIGALIVGIIGDLIVLLGLPALYQYIFVAIVLLIAGLQARESIFVK